MIPASVVLHAALLFLAAVIGPRLIQRATLHGLRHMRDQLDDVDRALGAPSGAPTPAPWVINGETLAVLNLLASLRRIRPIDTDVFAGLRENRATLDAKTEHFAARAYPDILVGLTRPPPPPAQPIPPPSPLKTVMR